MQDLSDHIVDMVEHSLMNLWDPRTVEMAHIHGLFAHFEGFQHLKFNLQRQSGHTNAAMKIAEKYSDTIIVVPSQAVRNHTIRRLHDFNITSAYVVCLHKILDKPERIICEYMGSCGEKQIVIFDQASRMEQGDLTRALHWLVESDRMLLAIELQ